MSEFRRTTYYVLAHTFRDIPNPLSERHLGAGEDTQNFGFRAPDGTFQIGRLFLHVLLLSCTFVKFLLCVRNSNHNSQFFSYESLGVSGLNLLVRQIPLISQYGSPPQIVILGDR